jgi:hypothetical protein
MPDAYRHQSGYGVDIANRCANREDKRSGVSGRMRVRFGTDFTRIVTCCRLAALVISGGVLISLMHRAGALMLVDGARRRSASGCASDTEAETVYQKRDYRDDLDVRARLHFLSRSDSSDFGLRSQGPTRAAPSSDGIGASFLRPLPKTMKNDAGEPPPYRPLRDVQFLARNGVECVAVVRVSVSES